VTERFPKISSRPSPRDFRFCPTKLAVLPPIVANFVAVPIMARVIRRPCPSSSRLVLHGNGSVEFRRQPSWTFSISRRVSRWLIALGELVIQGTWPRSLSRNERVSFTGYRHRSLEIPVLLSDTQLGFLNSESCVRSPHLIRESALGAAVNYRGS
jgi:hypothetical protein